MKRRLFLSLATVALLGANALHADNAVANKRLTLEINGHALHVSVARTPAERSMGLMFATKLGKDDGMLFLYPEAAISAMWMKNTNVALSVAFIDEQGVIINIEDMQPRTLDPHASERPAKYSIETNLGWFERNGIGPGAKVKGLEKAPKAE
jgi:uncharacterized membrane protein (UPF0127 family)